MGLLENGKAAADTVIWVHHFLNRAAVTLEWAYGHTADGFAWVHYFYMMRCRCTRMGPLAYTTDVAVTLAWAY